MASQPSTAVVLTGMERSFNEIGQNIREALLHLLDSQSAVFFGVRPPHDTWPSIRTLLPFAPSHIDMQRKCWTSGAQNDTIAWMHCDFRLRAGDCRLSFLQALCDPLLSHMASGAKRARTGKLDRMVPPLPSNLLPPGS